MNIALQITCNLAVVLEPFTVYISKLFAMLNMPILKSGMRQNKPATWQQDTPLIR